MSELLSPLLTLRPPPPPKPVRRVSFRVIRAPRSLIVGVYDGSEPITSDYRVWRFNTFVPQLTASYFERWLTEDPAGRKFFLERAYLHLFYPFDLGSPEEFLALHCDPNEVDPAATGDESQPRHGPYKRDLHVHMVAARPPLSHSHIALNQLTLDSVLTSIESLAAAQKAAVMMLREQVLKLFLGEFGERAA